MASHGVARTDRTRTRTEKQRQQELSKITTYRDLETQVRAKVAARTYDDPDLFKLTTKLLRLNPEYYTIWNVRRRCLISGLLCKPPGGSWPSRESPSSSPSATTRPSSGASLHSSSAPTQLNQNSPTTGGSGTTVDDDDDEKNKSGSSSSSSNNNNNNNNTATTTTTTEEQQESDENVLQAELDFTIPLLLEFPKCYWIWNFRQWILAQAIQRLLVTKARHIWEMELGLVSKMLTKDRRNFHAWGYRRYVVATLESPALQGTSMVESEFVYTTKMIEKDLSNFSAWHNRSQLLLRVLDERGADDEGRARFLDEELELVKGGLNVGPEDQSLWYYHQFLVSQIATTDQQQQQQQQQSRGAATIAPALTSEERIGYIRREIDDVKDLLEDYKDVKWIYEALLEYSITLKQVERAAGREGEGEDPRAWLEKVRALDPMRGGRWSDVEAQLLSVK